MPVSVVSKAEGGKAPSQCLCLWCPRQRELRPPVIGIRAGLLSNTQLCVAGYWLGPRPQVNLFCFTHR